MTTREQPAPLDFVLRLVPDELGGYVISVIGPLGPSAEVRREIDNSWTVSFQDRDRRNINLGSRMVAMVVAIDHAVAHPEDTRQ